jgi:hypothetical protein
MGLADSSESSSEGCSVPGDASGVAEVYLAAITNHPHMTRPKKLLKIFIRGYAVVSGAAFAYLLMFFTLMEDYPRGYSEDGLIEYRFTSRFDESRPFVPKGGFTRIIRTVQDDSALHRVFAPIETLFDLRRPLATPMDRGY